MVDNLEFVFDVLGAVLVLVRPYWPSLLLGCVVGSGFTMLVVIRSLDEGGV